MGYRTPTCPIARECGGCEWLAVPYPIQLERKQAQVEGLLGGLARADGAEVEPICGMDDPQAFRHKAATPFSPDARGRIRSGFYARGSHKIVRCEACLVEDPRARRVFAEVVRVAERLHIPAYDEDRGIGVLRHAVLRTGYATDEALLTLVTNVERLRDEARVAAELHEAAPELTSIVQNVNTRRTNAILGTACHTLLGPGHMRDRLLGCTFEVGPTSFYQTNPAQTEVLYELAIRAAGLADGSRVLDAYCGAGTIGICAAARAAAAGSEVRVTGVERVASAVRLARKNARANGVGGRCEFVAADATAWLAGGGARDGRAGGGGDKDAAGHARPARGAFDVVILDPPRAGSTPEFLAAVADAAPGRVVYVSCNPITQARDLEVLRGRGYRLTRVAAVDMFPHTSHVETVVSLTR